MLGYISASLAFAFVLGGICGMIHHFFSPKPFFSVPLKSVINLGSNVFVMVAIVSSFVSITITDVTALLVINSLIAIAAIGFTLFVSVFAMAIAKFVRHVWK